MLRHIAEEARSARRCRRAVRWVGYGFGAPVVLRACVPEYAPASSIVFAAPCKAAPVGTLSADRLLALVRRPMWTPCCTTRRRGRPVFPMLRAVLSFAVC